MRREGAPETPPPSRLPPLTISDRRGPRSPQAYRWRHSSRWCPECPRAARSMAPSSIRGTVPQSGAPCRNPGHRAAIPGTVPPRKQRIVTVRAVSPRCAGAGRRLTPSGNSSFSRMSGRGRLRLRTLLLQQGAQRSSWMRIRLPAGSRKAQSRIPYGWSTGSWTTSASLA
jgi:hypothetical protein